MNFEFTEHGWEDFEYWIDTDSSIVEKIKDLLNEIKKTPFQGTGKPEPLRHDLKGFWSRRITGEHRLVYKIEGKKGWIKNVTSSNVGFTTSNAIVPLCIAANTKQAATRCPYRIFCPSPDER